MAPKAKKEPVYRKLSPGIIQFIRSRAPREVHNDDVATALGVTREQVRNSTRQMIKAHPEYGVTEVSPYVYTWSSPASTSEVSATGGWVGPHPSLDLSIPAVSVRRGGVTAAAESTCDFVLIKRSGDVIVLEDTDDHTLWVARKL